MTDIAGRTAFITGGANGLGLAMARSLANAGAKIALADLDVEALTRAKAELASLTDVATAVLDVRDREAYAHVADALEADLGPVSILVNNAGVAGGAPATRITYELWDWGMSINLDGVINGLQVFLPRIAARGQGGHIVNTASIAGLVAGAGNALYCTAKFAVVGLSEALHLELPPQGIGVTLLCPGPCATDIIERTRSFQPKVTKSMSADQKSKVFAAFGKSKLELANGTSPDVVGELIRAAITANRFYVLTDRTIEAEISARAAAMLDAMADLAVPT